MGVVRVEREVAGERFVVHCDERLRPQAVSLLELLSRMSASGSRFESGQCIDFGGMWFSLVRRGPERVVGRPVLQGQPVLGEDVDVSPLLECLVRQLAVARRVGVEPVEARLPDKVVIEKDCLSLPRLYLQRSEPGPGDSGWFIGNVERAERDESPGELAALPVWRLFHVRPALLTVLALPPEHLVVFSGDAVEAVLDASNQDVWAERR